jgi:molecular chaperone DnaJ
MAFSSTAPCSRCRGTGKLIHSPCKSCNGVGSQRKKKRISVTIPAGIDDGQAVSLRGQGNAGKNGGPAGDLIVGIRIKPHSQFRRDGVDVFYEHKISFYQAAMGAELEIPTIDGKVKYNLPAGTQPETTFRLRGKGIPGLHGRGRGGRRDHIPDPSARSAHLRGTPPARRVPRAHRSERGCSPRGRGRPPRPPAWGGTDRSAPA